MKEYIQIMQTGSFGYWDLCSRIEILLPFLAINLLLLVDDFPYSFGAWDFDFSLEERGTNSFPNKTFWLWM